MVKELHMISIIDYRTNELKAEVRRQMMTSELSKEQAVKLISKAYDDIIDTVCRLYDRAEV